MVNLPEGSLSERDQMKIAIYRILHKRMDEIIQDRLGVGLRVLYGEQINLLVEDLAGLLIEKSAK